MKKGTAFLAVNSSTLDLFFLGHRGQSQGNRRPGLAVDGRRLIYALLMQTKKDFEYTSSLTCPITWTLR